MVQESELDVYRIIKFDVDSFMAKQNQINQYEIENMVSPKVMDKDDEDDEDDFVMASPKVEDPDENDDIVMASPKVEDPDENHDMGYLKMFSAKIDHVDEKMSSIMDNIRKEYKDITFLQCLLYSHLVVFSIAATVAYMFYIPPGSAKIPSKKAPGSTLINIPVDFQNMKVPKKEIKKQLKNLVKGEKNIKDSML